MIAEEVMEALAYLHTPDGECTPLPTDAEIKEMFDSIKQHLVHEKEDELVRKLETNGEPALPKQVGKRNTSSFNIWLL